MEYCLVCGRNIEGQTGWTLCYDPMYLTNVWGGDTHDVMGNICMECGPKVKEVIKAQYAKGYIAGVKDGKDAKQDAEYDRGYKDGFESAEGGGEL